MLTNCFSTFAFIQNLFLFDVIGMTILVERFDGRGLNCSYLGYICDEDKHKEEDYCIEWCQEHPNSSVCKPEDQQQ